MFQSLRSAGFLSTSLLIALSIATPVNAESDFVNVYSARKEALIKPLLDKFSDQTGITVNLITGKADALLKRLQVEGSASPADIFLTVDAGRLQRAKDANVLQPIQNSVLEQTIPANLRDKDNQWFGLSQRARTIFFAKDKVKPSELSTYEDLASDKWKGRLCIRSSDNIYNQSLVASMIEANGAQATETWAKGLVANFAKPPAGGDTDQLRAAAAGVCDVTLANTYYFGRLANSQKAADQAIVEKLGVFWPNQQDRGVHMNVSGAGVTKSARNKDNAMKLLEFLVSHDSQEWYAQVNNEYPVVPGTGVSATLTQFGDFKADTVKLSKLGENNRAAVELMDRAGWK
ncbi:Fe(3+) ABC transporter substrate-binding protein [Neptunomonas marina]|uniref:Fe(3+) ABC transporter substrate-binding protein n=1 Tax=Neptunomonas marina TaxID=1815562 RepID=A0A437QCI4_9GAMM|nr:Fe(3+) ABC transporter substrate-binding protein [Neptunomonas marina]RVU32093.1 Fe(3+) ABC transporter substrate-binding protein [Neptunomonas marina]